MHAHTHTHARTHVRTSLPPPIVRRRALRQQGKVAAAEAACRRGLAVLQGVLGQRHPAVTTAASDVISLLQRQGKDAEVRACMYARACVRPPCPRALGGRPLGDLCSTFAAQLAPLCASKVGCRQQVAHLLSIFDSGAVAWCCGTGPADRLPAEGLSRRDYCLLGRRSSWARAGPDPDGSPATSPDR